MSENKTVYVLHKKGVYGHGVHGIYKDEESGVVALARAGAMDKDAYHQWELGTVEVGELADMGDVRDDGLLCDWGESWWSLNKDQLWKLVCNIREHKMSGAIVLSPDDSILAGWELGEEEVEEWLSQKE